MRRRPVLIVCLATAVLTVGSFGCAGLMGGGGPKNEILLRDPAFTSPLRVAVLPVDNETADLPAGELMRLLWCIGLQNKGFTVLSPDSVDARLLDLGVSSGGQLRTYDRSKLEGELGAKVLFGTLTEASNLTAGIKNKKAISMEIELASGGATWWKQTGKYSASTLRNLNPVKGLVEGTVNKQFDKMFQKYHGHPLEAEIESVIMSMLAQLPGKEVENSGW